MSTVEFSPNKTINWNGLLEFEKTLFVLANLMDVILTSLLLSTGSFYESNPIADFILQGWGLLGMIGFKLVTVAVVLAIANIVSIYRVKTARRLLYFGTAIVGSVVAYSFCLVYLFQQGL